MITFEGWSVPVDFDSDGCTFAPDTWFGVNLKPACVMHDFQRKHVVYYGALTVQEADKLFKRHLRALGAPRLLSHLYWLAVKLARSKFSTTKPMPTTAWNQYLKRSDDV